jgi:hypothetical protein
MHQNDDRIAQPARGRFFPVSRSDPIPEGRAEVPEGGARGPRNVARFPQEDIEHDYEIREFVCRPRRS